MMSTSNNIDYKELNVTPLFKKNNSAPVQNNGIMKEKPSGGDDMEKNYYTKDEIDLKLENIETKVDSKFDLLMQKMDDGFEKQSLRMEKLLLNFKDDLNKEQKENKRWLVGIFVGSLLSIIGIIISIITILTQK